MHKSKTLTIGKQDITVRDLTPREVDQLLGETVKGTTGTSMGILMESNLPTEAVAMSTGLKEDVLLDGEFSLEELAEVWKAVEEVNGFLSRRLAAISKLGLESIVGKASEG